MTGVVAHRRISRGIEDADTTPVRLNTQYLRYVLDAGGDSGSFYYALTGNTVFSIWFKRNTATAGGALIGKWQGGTVVNTFYGTIPSSFFHIYVGSCNTGPGQSITADQVRFRSYNEGSGAGNTNVDFTWSGIPTDAEWHHLAIHISTWSPAFPGNFEAVAYLDGQSLGTQTTGGAGTRLHSQVLFKTLGIGRSAILNSGFQIGFQGTPALTPLSGSYPGGYLEMISDYWSACVNQIWIGTVNTFRIADFYGGGIVDLGADGTSGGTQILPTPAFYNRLIYPTDLELVANNAIVSQTIDNQCI